VGELVVGGEVVVVVVAGEVVVVVVAGEVVVVVVAGEVVEEVVVVVGATEGQRGVETLTEEGMVTTPEAVLLSTPITPCAARCPKAAK
jgi:hypothetical protein